MIFPITNSSQNVTRLRQLYRPWADLPALGGMSRMEARAASLSNFPCKSNIAYSGESYEAHMVCRFSFPPVIDAFSRRGTSDSKNITNRKRQDLFF